MAYYINLFTQETWGESQRQGWTVTGHTSRLRNRSKIEEGDVFLCYVTGLSAFVGAIRVVGPAYEVGPDGERIWKRALFPLRYPVELITRTSLSSGVSLQEVREHSSTPEIWRWIFRNSGNEIPEDEGEWILERLRESPADDEDALFEMDNGSADEDVPEGNPAPEEELVGLGDLHHRTQLLLAELGRRSGYEVWIARNDRSATVDGQVLGDLSLEKLPDWLPPDVLKTVSLIDVLWLTQGRTYVAAFEIETSTQIFTGLLRMGDLVAAAPNFSIPLFIVAPEDRRRKVFAQMSRPLFRYGLNPPLDETCSYVPLEVMRQDCERFADSPGIDGLQLIRNIEERLTELAD